MKHSASNCNKELLSYLHENINRINRNYNLKVVIVYNEMLPKLKNRISSLPALLIGDTVTIGNSNIKNRAIIINPYPGAIKAILLKSGILNADIRIPTNLKT